jgi:hypothetical protein
MRIAITGGSRGISNLPLFLRLLADELKNNGAIPFIVPAMGSHGGATAEGQRELLERMGITEEYVGIPIQSSMETVQIGIASNGLPVVVDKLAWEADGIFLVNRIKPHVGFRGRYESGLIKMLAIGLGKQHGAEICHQLGFGRMEENILAIVDVCLNRCQILGGIALVENPYHETCKIEVLRKEEIIKREPELQELSKKLLPKIHIHPLDVLVIDEIGKNIGGTGFDNNVVGRFHTPYVLPRPEDPKISRIVALDLTSETKGNANGLGILDFTTQRVFDRFSMEETYPNCLTSTVTASVKIPMVLKNDLQAIQAAIKTSNIIDFTTVRLARIKNTLALDVIEISENLIGEAQGNPFVEVLHGPYTWNFDTEGNLKKEW